MVAAVKKEEGSESPSAMLCLKVKLGKQLHVYSVDSSNRRPIQGWSSGASGSDVVFHHLDETCVAEEVARPFTLDKETRWPLQGWCKPYKLYNTPVSSEDSSKPSIPSRWPQGW